MLPALVALATLAFGRAVYPRYLERRQARRRPVDPDGIVRGASPIELERDDAPAVLLLHGAGDTPQVLQRLGSHLHARGFAVSVPLLHGHGRSLSALRDVSAQAWRAQVRSEFDRLHELHGWVGVVGLSMGGALAIDLVAHDDRAAALVLLAPYVAMPPRLERMAETSRYWSWAAPYFSSRGGASIRDSDAARLALGHGLFTPAMLLALRDVARTAWRRLPDVTVPTLVIQSRNDNRIDPDLAERGFARLGSARRKFVWVEGAGHVISVDFGYQRVFDLTTRWLETHRPASRV